MINLVIPTLIMSTIALTVAIAAMILVLAQKFSTHKIEWKPLTFDELKEEIDEEQELIEEGDGKTLEEALKLQRKGKKPKVEDPLDSILESNNF